MQQLNIDVISNRNVGIVFHDDLNICEPHSHTFFELAYINPVMQFIRLTVSLMLLSLESMYSLNPATSTFLKKQTSKKS